MNKFHKVSSRTLPYGVATHYTNPLGTNWLHVTTPSINNVFITSLKTPGHSTGISHILEHTTLCGSEKYPIRDPFFKMLNRSMSTYMNALTGGDLTMYPFSTQNKSDYYNLMGVYLDAVYKPLLKETDFKQEGWRLAPVTNNTGSPLEFKGVVYNEMKGVMADTSSIFVTRHDEHMYAGSTYGENSGGEPKVITSLDVNTLRNYHKECYHPSNTLIYTFGNLDIDEQIAVVEQNFEGFSVQEQPKIKDVKRWTSRREVEIKGPLDTKISADNQVRTAMSFLLGPSSDATESISMRILSDLLLDGASSPMYKGLISSGLGSEYSPTTGYNPYNYTSSMSFGVQGVAGKDVAEVQQRVMEILEKSGKKGFEKARIDAVFHQIELGLKHRTSGFGMNLGMGVVRNYIHGGDLMDGMEFMKNIQKVKELMGKDGYLESMLKEKFVQNNHVLKMSMVPSSEYPQEIIKEEKERLHALVSKLSEEDRENVIQDNIKLTALQDAKIDLSCLPCLSLDQVSKESVYHPITMTTSSGLKSTFRETITNGVSYVTLRFNVSHLKNEELHYLPLFCRVLTSLGTKEKSLGELDEAIKASTGGISASCYVCPSLTSTDSQTYLIISGNAIDENITQLYALINEVLFKTDWDALKELKNCLTSEATEMNNSIVEAGHVYAMKTSASFLSASLKRQEILSGMTQVKFLIELMKAGEVALKKDLAVGTEDLMVTLKGMTPLLLTKPEVFVISESTQVQNHKDLFLHLTSPLSVVPVPSTTNTASEGTDVAKEMTIKEKEGLLMDIGVNYICRSYKGANFTHEDSAGLKVLASLLTTKHFHPILREKNGAYGGGAKYDVMNGVLQFYTYRDPPPSSRTFAVFDEALGWSRALIECEDEELERAKMEILKGLDMPKSASGEGKDEVLMGMGKVQKEQFRARLMAVGRGDVTRVAELYLSVKGVDAVVGKG